MSQLLTYIPSHTLHRVGVCLTIQRWLARNHIFSGTPEVFMLRLTEIIGQIPRIHNS